MKILAALVFLSVAAGVTPVEKDACGNRIHCPCGSTGKNVTICAGEDSKDEPCRKWLQCKTCQDNLNSCFECPEGLEGPFCSTASRRNNVTRRKRQLRFQRFRPRTENRFPTSPLRQGGRSCPDLQSPKLGSIRCLTNDQARTCVGKCLPGYSYEGRGKENEITLTCTGGNFAPLAEFPPCKSGGHCDLVPQGAGSFNCTTGMDGTRCDVFCNGRFTGRYFCYPGQPWSPSLPYCMKPKVVEDYQSCNCEYGGICDSNGNCVCPVGRTGRFCETIVPEKQTCSDPGFVVNGVRRNTDESDASNRRIFDEGESVVYGCASEEYALQGSSLIICKKNGRWSNPLPNCIRTRESPDTSLSYCSDPGVDPDGRRIPRSPPSRRGFPQGSQLEYSCNRGYDLRGETIIFCYTSGEWSSERPLCEPHGNGREPASSGSRLNYCLDPGVDPNGRRNPQLPPNQRGFPPGSQLKYSCNRGYHLQGETNIFCLASGDWSDGVPTCGYEADVPVTPETDTSFCRDPGVDPNGRRNPQSSADERGFPQGSQVQYSCNQGYELVGDSILFCFNFGEWSSGRPICDLVRREPERIEIAYCQNPGSISNGRAEYYPVINNRQRIRPQTTLDDPEYPKGGRIQYYCNRGYNLEGSGSLTCEENGYWSAERPVCRRGNSLTFCRDPGVDPNGSRVTSTVPNPRGFREGTRLNYSCNQGYDLEGEESLSCLPSGVWSSQTPTCNTQTRGSVSGNANDRLTCLNPGPIQNGIIRNYPPGTRPRTGSTNLVAEDTRDFPEGTRLDYECNEGYNLEGTIELTCESNGLWSPPTAPKCNSDCGRSVMGTTRRILRGNKTSIGEWPWIVAIAVQESNGPRLICGGAVLNTQTVITAAHCLKEASQFILYFGKYYRSTTLDDEQVQDRMSRTIIINPDFNNDTLDSDIALIKFRPIIKFTDRVQPICLPTGESTAKNLRQNTARSGYVTGWGRTEKRLPSNELFVAQLPFVTNEACLQSFRENVPNFIPVLTQNMFCAGYHDARQATCSGDSGSPLVYYDGMTERFTLEGLVSFGVEGQCGLPGRLTVFTKVVRFLSWIYKNM